MEMPAFEAPAYALIK